MESVIPIMDAATRTWNSTAKHAAYIMDLQENMEVLRNAMQQLKERRDDVKGRVEREEEQPRTKRTNEATGWLDRVQDLEKQADEILQKGYLETQKKSILHRSFKSSYKLGKKASDMLPAAIELWNSGHFDAVTVTLPPPPADERPMQKTVGIDATYAEVCRFIQDDQLGIIGLYGMGGAGKTTLMNKVNNDFIAANHDFDIAIWAAVSRPANLGKVQEVIRNKLNIPDHTWRNRNPDEKAVEIFNTLKRKRFVLLLDDVWERLDLQKVGVPSPNDSQNRSCSKVILTTRSLDVCRHMEAQRIIKVECLTEEEAMSLFKEKVGETTLNSHPEIPQLAEIMAKECKGLPLALVTIGRAMVGKNTPQDWERAMHKLKAYPSEFSGMGDYVFPILKFSYDNLPNETIKNCFLYLAMFPEDYEISYEDLMMLWIGEGFLDKWSNIEEAYNQGHDIIEHLKTACLFETGSNPYEDMVKMHDVIRDMALWLATAYTGNKNKILVEEVDGSVQVLHQTWKWKDAERMHLWVGTCLDEFTIPPSFPNLSTLIVRARNLETFPHGFFLFMSFIKVLDLGGTGITQLPVEFGKLVTLEYLNLSYTGIKVLSTELKTLKKLTCLVLDDMRKLEMISKQVISNLSMMRIFSLYFSYETRHLWKDNKSLLEELEGLEHINCVYLRIEGALSFQKLLSSQKLKNVMRSLILGNLEGMALLQLPKMRHLKRLSISRCRELQEIQVDHGQDQERGRRFVAYSYIDDIRKSHFSIPKPCISYCGNNYIPSSNFSCLRSLTIVELPKLLDLSWLTHTPGLEDLYVSDCESMKEVVGDGVPEKIGIFSRLKRLSLIGLSNLRRISGGGALPFPSLIELQVSRCPKLRKLPLDSNSARNSLKEIEGESEWWEGLQWEDEATRLTFTPYFTLLGRD